MAQDWLNQDLTKGIAGTRGGPDQQGGPPPADPLSSLKAAADRAYNEVYAARNAMSDQMYREEQLRAQFAHKVPNEEQQRRFQALRTAFANLGVTILQNTQSGPAQDVVIGNLRLCLMMTNASIADEGQ